MAGPIVSVQPGMGEPVLILTLVVVFIIGGLGSIRGAFCAALIVGVVDTLGRLRLRTDHRRTLFRRSTADAAGLRWRHA